LKFTKRVRLAFSILLLGLVAWNTDWASFFATLQKLRPEIWGLAVGVLCVTQVVSAVRWRLLARAFGFQESVSRLTAYYFIGMYFNLLLPTSVGGDVVRAWYLDAGSGRKASAFLSVLLDRLSGLLVLLALACLGVALSPLAIPAWIAWSVWSIAATALASMMLAAVAARHGGRYSNRLRQVRDALFLLRRPRVLLAVTGLSIFVQAANVVIVIIVGQALQLSVPSTFYWILVPMVTLLTLLPISLNGMGVREGATALLLAPFGVAQGAALGLALAWFAVHALASLLGGLVYLFGRFPKPAASATTNDAGEGNETLSYHSDQGRTGKYQAAA